MKEVVLATNNPGKITELQAILAPIVCISQRTLGIESVDETGLTFIENAIIKARHASKMTNKPALADDSGIVVTALNGEPGIYAARYAGLNATDDENIDLLLANLNHIPEGQRQAYYYCAIVLMQHADDPTPLLATGMLTGQILKARQGDRGFGYDPIFYLPNLQCTAAQLPTALKNTISHRALALKQLKEQLAPLPLS